MAKIATEAVAEQASGASSAAEWTRSTRKELVSRVVHSNVFARSERLSALLTYVCDMTLKGRATELNEQRIGHAVFGRKPDYDSSADGIVRTQASRLRVRLDQYFSGEGAAEVIRIEIPKGGYVPIFTEQRPAPLPVEDTLPAALPPLVPDPVATLPQPARRRWPQALPWVLCVLVALTTWYRSSSNVSARPRPHLLWSRVFDASRPTLEVPGDSGLVLSYLFTQRGVSLNEYLAGQYRTASTASQAAGGPAIPIDIANRRYTSIVDLAVAVQLQKIASREGSSLQVRYARDLRPNDLKSGNAVLVGAFEGNPWLEMFEPRMKFQMVNDYQHHIFTVVNRSPRSGEPERWQSSTNDPLRRVYGVVALMPNLSGDGSVLIVEGTSMAGVEAAWDFVSDDEVLLPVLHKMQRGDGTLPSFEILVGTQNMGASASHADLLAWDTH